MALLTVASAAAAGIDIVGAAATATTGDTFANTGKEFLLIKNGSGGTITVTLDHQNEPDGAVVTDPTVSIDNGVTKLIGPFSKGYYNDASGLVKATCSAVSSVTIKAIQFLPAS
jgi:hypothetical protein